MRGPAPSRPRGERRGWSRERGPIGFALLLAAARRRAATGSDLLRRFPRIRLLCAFAALGAGAVLAGCPRASEPKPPQGILLVVLDCLRADHVGVYGSRFPASPRLDELAAEGTTFERAWSQASWTRPSLPSLLTGLYPSEHGLSDSFSNQRGKLSVRALADEAETLAEGLAARGYRTALFGDQVQLSPTFHVDQGFEEFKNKLGKAPNIRRRFEGWVAEKPEAPFFAYLHFLDLHWPYCSKGARGRFDADPDSRSFCDGWRALGDRLASGKETLSPRDLVALRARYAEQMLDLDFELGKMFDAMKAAGRWDETLIVVTADHGEELFEHGGFRHGHTMYEELLHVPLLFKLPKSWERPGGAKVAGLVETRSITPTLLAAAGAPLPARISAPSLMPWLLGRPAETAAKAPVEIAVAESNGLFAVRDERFKLIVDTTKMTKQLFDLAADPGEANDLAAAEPARLAAMEQHLRAWRSALKPLPARGGAEVDADQIEELKALGYIQ